MGQSYIWQPEFESMERDALDNLKLQRLQETVRRVYTRVPLYRERMHTAGVSPQDVRSLEDAHLLPFTGKDDFRTTYPYGLLAVPASAVVRLHASSGTTGKPTVVAYTASDMEVWRNLVARFLAAAGVTENDTVQVAFGYGLFTGAFGLHQGLEHIGATVVPASSGNTRRQLMLMQDLGVTALVCTPTYALTIGEAAQKEGLAPRSLGLELGIFGAEPWTEELRQQLEALFGFKAYDNYGLSEVVGPGVSGECSERHGLHLYEDCFLAEVVDPETGTPLREGEQGELVLTTLAKEALPVIRYRTGDITRLRSDPCPCGRTIQRMDRITGRTDDMLIIRGVNVFPSQVESALLAVEGVVPQYQLVVKRVGTLDDLEVRVEVSEKIFTDEMKGLRQVQERLADELETTLGLRTKVTLVEPGALPRSQGKAQRVLDHRRSTGE